MRGLYANDLKEAIFLSHIVAARAIFIVQVQHSEGGNVGWKEPSPAINLDENLNVAKGKKLHYMYVYYVIRSLTNVTRG